jgi:class 3 adenylate cyclase/uncharacterized protein YndB with AHSA1/START domain
METKTQHGYLVLADISGFTSYLAKVELDHAHEILTDLLEAIVGRFKTLLTISKLEGDAVFAYAPESILTRGETLLELVESTYVTFRDRVAAAHRRTTCDCRACQAIPTLDLKFFVHRGDYIVQTVSGIRELVGSDVNLAHRLMKNHVAEATGWKAYALFTEKGLEHLGVRPDGLHAQVETVEHLGDVQTYSLNMRPRYEALIAARHVVVSLEEAHVITAREYPAPPPVVWEWLNDPKKRALWAPEEVVFNPIALPGGRTGVGARTHCVHGKKLFMVETVLDWRPFDYFTVEQVMGVFSEHATFRLTPTTDGGTRLELRERGKLTSLKPLDRLITFFMLTRMMPTTKVLELLGRRISEALVRDHTAEAPGTPAAATP